MHFSATQLLSPSRSSIHTSTLQQFLCRIISAKVEALRLSATQKRSLQCRGSDWSCPTGPLSKQAQESLRWDFTPPCYLLLIPFPVKSTAPHLWIICTKFINGTKLDQLFINAAKEKQEVRTEPGRQKRTEAFQMCQQRGSHLFTLKVKWEPGKLHLLWWMWHPIIQNISYSPKHLPAPRTVTSSQVLHPEPSHLKSNQHTNSSCCFTKHKEEFYCFSHKNEKDNL